MGGGVKKVWNAPRATDLEYRKLPIVWNCTVQMYHILTILALYCQQSNEDSRFSEQS
jgi:hypothetical protein